MLHLKWTSFSSPWQYVTTKKWQNDKWQEYTRVLGEICVACRDFIPQILCRISCNWTQGSALRDLLLSSQSSVSKCHCITLPPSQTRRVSTKETDSGTERIRRAKIIIYYFWNDKFRKSLIAWIMNGAANGNIFLYETENQQNNPLLLQDLK